MSIYTAHKTPTQVNQKMVQISHTDCDPLKNVRVLNAYILEVI